MLQEKYLLTSQCFARHQFSCKHQCFDEVLPGLSATASHPRWLLLSCQRPSPTVATHSGCKYTQPDAMHYFHHLATNGSIRRRQCKSHVCYMNNLWSMFLWDALMLQSSLTKRKIDSRHPVLSAMAYDGAEWITLTRLRDWFTPPNAHARCCDMLKTHGWPQILTSLRSVK